MAQQGGVLTGMIWMLVISLLFFWFPLGPLLAGLVGGKKSGGVGNALLAVLLPGVLITVLLLFFGAALTGLPIIGAVFAFLGGMYYVAGLGTLLIGAIIGGLMA